MSPRVRGRRARGLEPALLQTDQRILAVQVIKADGTVVRRSASAPDIPLMPLSEISDGLHIGMPEHDSPYGQIRFSAQTVDGPGGRYTVLVGEGSQVVFATVKTVVIALALAAPIVVAVSAAVTYILVSRSMRSVDEIRSRVAEISTSDLTERVPVPEKRDEISALAAHHERDAGPDRGRAIPHSSVSSATRRTSCAAR